MSRSRSKQMDFVHQFEGAQVLDGLLELAGTSHDSLTVLAHMRQAHAEGRTSQEVIPGLFEHEPRFGSPELARRLFQNLLGLWDLVEEGKPVRLEEGPRAPKPKKQKTEPPRPFAPGEPDTAFVEAAWRYLEDDAKARTRLHDAFENKQDALLGVLDAAGLTDEGYGVARHLLFELHAMLELGWPQGLASVAPEAMEAPGTEASPVPSALTAYADEALFEAEQDEEHPLSPEELAKVRTLVKRGGEALWSARKGK
ncbi:hypothetical protein [Vitiosangium sp. GDMCC 1.1324]|uniref:hypothetical protein n=1 Tax=Vitiosangium sp. (strain GDMCC 1.1324) TaxID=2138576 RepID=UPI000D343EB1|nr:hypothetical protein [Vitiosangium sp. GDMCC 1.1324]PTL80044.1 hypothetical protein DAT35_32040 [Vitiosangium sp. GDMCC 1.1324]